MEVDKTIENICQWVNKELSSEDENKENTENVINMVQALAALITARAAAF